MPRKITNIAGRTRKGSQKNLEVLGIKEMQAKINDLKDSFAGPAAQAVVGESADLLYDAVVANAKSVHVPHEVLEDIFSYNKSGRNRQQKLVSALVGIRKAGRALDAKAYATWHPGSQVGAVAKETGKIKRTRGSKTMVIPGTVSAKGKAFGLQKIGESLATMWELGTSKMQARPFFGPAVTSTRGAIMATLAAGFKGILAKYSRAA